MKAKRDTKPTGYEYEVLHDGTALVRFFENAKKYTVKGENGRPDQTGYEYDEYTITRPHSDHLSERIAAEPGVWLEFAKQENAAALAAEVRTRRDGLLYKTDKTQIADAPLTEDSREAFKVYRQALRDIPEQAGFPHEVEWPDEPIIENAAR